LPTIYALFEHGKNFLDILVNGTGMLNSVG